MKTILVLAALLGCLAVPLRAGIIAGPIANPTNGHDYYLLTPNTWSASEEEAESLGGTLSIIQNADEQKWVFSTFGASATTNGTVNRNLWIGLHRVGPQRSLEWVGGGKPDYANWTGGQPDDASHVEGVVFIASASRPWGFLPGGWADIADGASAGDPLCGVVEVPGKSREKSVTEKEKSLIGTWYESGKADRPAWITGTQTEIFLIGHDRHAARLVLTPDGFISLIFNGDRLHGEIVKDKILWSNGTWCSRKPNAYESRESTMENDDGQVRSDHNVPD